MASGPSGCIRRKLSWRDVEEGCGSTTGESWAQIACRLLQLPILANDHSNSPKLALCSRTFWDRAVSLQLMCPDNGIHPWYLS